MGDSTPQEELRALFQEAHATSDARVVAIESRMEARVAQTESKLEAQLQQLSRQFHELFNSSSRTKNENQKGT